MPIFTLVCKVRPSEDARDYSTQAECTFLSFCNAEAAAERYFKCVDVISVLIIEEDVDGAGVVFKKEK